MSNIPYSILELATVNDKNTIQQTLENTLDLARHAEEWGYTRFWFAEHHNMKSVASAATAILIGYVAGGTKKIRVGSGGIMLPNHTPLIVAEQFGTLGSLYPDRIDLGLGRAPGTDQITAAALRRDKMAAYQFPDNVQELIQYFSKEHADAKVRAVPRDGIDIPVWILGSSTDSARLAAAMGLPYSFAAHFAPTQFEQAIEIYRNNFQPSPQLDKPYVMACINAIAADTQEEAEFLSTSLFVMFRSIITGITDYFKPPVEDISTVLSEYERAVLPQMLKYTFIGDKATLSESLDAFIKRSQVDEVMFTSYVYDHQKRLRSNELVAEVMKAMG